MNGAKILLECLKKEGVDTVFGYPGGVVLPLFDEIYNEKAIKLVLVRHEQGAAHMADGYSRSTGKTGVCLATSGPGATNLVTGIATAYMDSIPMVALTGQVNSSLIGNDAFQEADMVGITRPIVKHNYLVKDVKDLAQTIKNAFHIASTGRPGPVLVDLPKDVFTSELEFSKYPDQPLLRGYKPTYDGSKVQIKKAAEMIEKAQRPLLYVGGGVVLSNASEELIKFAEKTDIPITTTLMAMDVMPSNHKLNLGMLGMHGTKFANYAVQESDLLIAVGARFDDRVTGKVADFAPHADIIHIDIDPSAISKIIKVDLPIVGSAKNILPELTKEVKKKEHKEWNTQISQWKKDFPLSYRDSDSEIKPQYVIQKISEMVKDDTIITTEVGQHQMWTAQFYRFRKNRTFLTSGGLGTMGYGFPAAIGAQAGNPDKLVIDIAGDGSIQMNIQELATAVKYKLPVKVAILNNGYLGMVRQWQELFYGKRYSHTIIDNSVDFVKLAEAYGAKGIRIDKKQDVEKALKEAFAYDGPVIMDFITAREENVWPMVPAGAALGKMIEGELA
ncbi:MAG: acetolactate synthase, large subunit, biosynthetic type [Candidatus Goldiibacteriota bacterium HGW-Goldbacteria-1]|jgi:acetolactate synthase-1/2/3 large subunit|nr:MAG: acetolactate synthase, large subunit, biosynthetic type [Candidatus Goldiibacteriota bacterium HGW-Goldbacteria-1]